MKIDWDWSLESETDRILQTAHSIANGFFQLQHFHVLPWKSGQKYLPTGVYMPTLPYSSIKHFWTQVGKLDDRQIPFKSPTELIRDTQSLLASLRLVAPDVTHLAQLTQKTMPRVNQFLRATFPDLELPQQVNIFPSYFSTVGSFNWLDSSKEVFIYPRIDQGIRTVVECYLSSILRPTVSHQYSAAWSESEILVDWLIQATKLNQIVPPDPNWVGTMISLRLQYDYKIQKISEDFLRKIGVPLSTYRAFRYQYGTVYFRGTPLTNLTARETNLLEQLIAKFPTSLTLDQIGNILFTQDEKFSLAAINKAIERLRDKFDRLGISRHYLATASGVGYYLKN